MIMDRVDKILRIVAKEISKSSSHYKEWTEHEMAMMDIARWGESSLRWDKNNEGMKEVDRLIKLYDPVKSGGIVYRYPTKGGVERAQLRLDEDTRMALMARFQKWERRNWGPVSPHPYTTRVEWYRQDIILRFS